MFPHSQMNHEHESWKTLVCHLVNPPCIAQLVEVHYQGWILEDFAPTRNYSHAGALPLPWEGNSPDPLETIPVGNASQEPEKIFYLLQLIFSCSPSGCSKLSFSLTFICYFYSLVVTTATTHARTNLLSAINQRLQRSPCAHAHLLPNPLPTHMKSLSRGTSLLIHISIKSI